MKTTFDRPKPQEASITLRFRLLHIRTVSIVISALLLSGCYFLRGSGGGGQEAGSWQAPRHIDPHDVALVRGYAIEPFAQGLTFPTGITFDDEGRAYVVESGYSYGEVFETPKLLRVEADGSTKTIAEGISKNGPWTSVNFYRGNFYVAEGGERDGGKILKISPQGRITELVTGLPSMGDHHTNSAVIGPDGYIYFGQGTATNSGVVGVDNAKFGWLRRRPGFHDIPCRDITLNGVNFETEDALASSGSGEKRTTGAYSAYGTPTQKGQIIHGKIPCTGSVMRFPLAGGPLELVAWGFRNPFGLAFASDGQLFVTENAYDDRGSRPIWGAGDVLWKVKKGAWYGWPDYSAGESVANSEFAAPGKDEPTALIASAPDSLPTPVAIFGVHSSSNGFDFSKSDEFGYRGEAFVAQFGDQAPAVGKVLHPVGFKVVRVNVNTGVIEDFAVNAGSDNGPASALGSGGLERPVAARFDRKGGALYIVDFGVLLMSKEGASPKQHTGVVWKITKGGRKE
ncbi:MAG TPA: PQQ-dependent sugar dehydrogenase [Bacteroidota bacterium]|nr:PQQ-dependent sugar dehydrogenase [Bacteroidota bacterium]